MRLRMQTYGRAGPLRTNMAEHRFEHRAAEALSAEIGCRQHAADADIGVFVIRQQHAQIARQFRARAGRMRAVREQMPRVDIESIDIAIQTVLLDHEDGCASSEHVVDLDVCQIVESLPAPFERRSLFALHRLLPGHDVALMRNSTLKKEKPRNLGAFLCFWRREPESNRSKRLCRPLHNRFAIAPKADCRTVLCCSCNGSQILWMT